MNGFSTETFFIFTMNMTRGEQLILRFWLDFIRLYKTREGIFFGLRGGSTIFQTCPAFRDFSDFF